MGRRGVGRGLDVEGEGNGDESGTCRRGIVSVKGGGGESYRGKEGRGWC